MLRQYVSHDDIVRVIKKHKGSRDSVVRKFVDMHIETLQFNNFLIDLTNVLRTAHNDNLILEISGETVVDPILTPMISRVFVWLDTNDWMLSNFSILREHAYPSLKIQEELRYDDVVNASYSYMEMNNMIRLQYPKD